MPAGSAGLGVRRAATVAGAFTAVMAGAAAGHWLGGLLAALGLVGAHWLLCERRAGADPQAVSDRVASVRPARPPDRLWRDTEAALQQLDRDVVAGDDIATISARLARAGRRAVEAHRSRPGTPEAARARRLLCLAGGSVADLRTNAPSVDERMAALASLEQTAIAVERELAAAQPDRVARARIAVLRQAIDQHGEKRMTTTESTALERPRDEAARTDIDTFAREASAAFDLDRVRDEQRALIDEIRQSIDPETPERFAEHEALGVSRFADAIVESARSAELGSVHDHLTELRLVTRRLGDNLEPSGILGRFFFNGRQALERFTADWDSVAGQIDAVIATLEQDRRGSSISIENLRGLRAEALDNFRRMAAAIVAGREVLDDRRERLVELRNASGSEGDTVEAAELRRREQQLDLLDRRLTNLEKSRAIAAGMIPTIQQTLHSEVVVAEELDMALTQAIPVMKQQLALTVEQVRQKERLQSLSATRETTEKMMGEIADRLQTGQEHLDRQVREGIASAEEVASFIARIGDTIDEIDRRQAEAQQDRAAARTQLQAAVTNLGERLAGPAREVPASSTHAVAAQGV